MIVVTGGSGFLGSWIVRALYSAGIELVVLVRPNSDCWRLTGLKDLNIVRSRPEDWPATISTIRPRVVITSDWEGVDTAHRNSSDIQVGNVVRTHAVAEAAKASGVKVFIALGSQAEIGPHTHPVDEVEQDNPITSYAESKVRLRRELSSVFADSKVRFVWARPFSIYGPLDDGSAMLPTLIRTLQSGNRFDATTGDQTWSYLYASDFASAIHRIVESPDFSGTVNVGNPIGLKIRDVIELAAQNMGRRELVNFGAVEIALAQPQYLVPVTSQLTNAGWRPEILIDVGIGNTVDWFMGVRITVDSLILPQSKNR